MFTPKLTSPATSPSPLTAFRQFDIAQSSHHLIISRIDLHLCDDSALDGTFKITPTDELAP
jgi:hypothetical protein